MGTKLKVNDFSSIKQAELELAQLTILIGPSASGKSVLSKLIFFFNHILVEQIAVLEDLKNIEHFKEVIKTNFKDWFPVDAWGGGKFVIDYEAGLFQVKISRIEYRKKLGDNIRVWLSPFFEAMFNGALESYKSLPASSQAGDYPFDTTWHLRRSLTEALKKGLKDDYHELQTFIPAGRSFFTSVGKSIAAFEHGRVLDPLIVRFGKFYANLRERENFRAVSRQQRDAAWSEALDKVMDGKMVAERSREYLQTPDGRRIPTSAMSSGQQELMPLILAIRSRSTVWERYQQLIFVEEPEAHLFPSSQSAIIEVFTAMLSLAKTKIRLVLTTHSPYVLAKINNLIKARQVAGSRRSKRYAEVANVVAENSWIASSSVAAYAINCGVLHSIKGEDGLIDAEYIDEVSGEMANEFSALLGIEVSK
ncbi:AAA family ATPase [Chiayiivirga flava]|uniref:Putative ATP-binding protein involved in virulence n=1 Tax=Chiayiivirga flava TaxID=659595 RepID=A0A7W8D5M2_9GAMM|nr:putative ATP-binding protein involved in virulence [Chiayiivirga flava]